MYHKICDLTPQLSCQSDQLITLLINRYHIDAKYLEKTLNKKLSSSSSKIYSIVIDLDSMKNIDMTFSYLKKTLSKCKQTAYDWAKNVQNL